MENLELKIEEMTKHFEELIRNQLKRIEDINTQSKKEENKKPIIIGICAGDGIGPIICKETQRILNSILAEKLSNREIEIKNIEGLTIENRIKKAKSIPDEVMAELKSCDVILKGPTTTPQSGAGVVNLESANVTLRKELDLYANVRPIVNKEKNIDWIFYRENTEGEYALGSMGVEIEGKLAIDFKVTTDVGTYRIAKAALDYAKKNGKTKVAIVTKANIMKKTDGNFSRICKEVAKDYPEIEVEDWYVDIMSANLINENLQSKFEVFVMPNLYGDILTDEAAQIQGGVGTAGSGNVGDRYAMFEAIHGSAPRMMERGLGEYANPSSMFRAVEMLLNHIGCVNEANKLKIALDTSQDEEKVIVTGNTDGATAREFTDYILELL